MSKKGKIAMKENLSEILYKNSTSISKKRRVISVSERAENESCSTHTRKSLIYKVCKVVKCAKTLSEPIVNITKTFDTKTKHERFNLKIKGVFYVIGGRLPFRVDFCHSLLVEIIPKNMTSYPQNNG